MLDKIKTKTLWLLEKIKKYWYLLLFAITAGYALVFAKNKDQIIEDMMKSRDEMLAAHNTRIQEIQAGIEAERLRRQEIEKSYNELLKTIEANKESRAKEILEENKVELRKIVERNRNNPEEMAAAVNRLFGITIVEQPATPPAENNNTTIPANPY